MAGAAETRVKHAWERYSEAQTPLPPTHPLPNQRPTRLLGILQPLERKVTPHPEGV